MRSKKTNTSQRVAFFMPLFFYITTSFYAPYSLAIIGGEPCTSTIDYQHPETPLSFSRAFFDVSNPNETVQGGSIVNTISRHRYDIRITHEQGTYSVFDHEGNRHDFIQNTDGVYVPVTENSGHLSQADGDFIWVNEESDSHAFQGSYLTQVINADGESVSLNYTNQRVQSITDEAGNSLNLEYDESGPSTLITPEGNSITLSSEICPGDDDSHTCDTSANPYPPIETSALGSFVTGLDLRPQSCESYFVEYFGTERGSRIEDGLAETEPYRSMDATVRSFPIVDFIDGDRFIAVRSRDLSNPSFNNDSNPNALLYRLNRDGQEIYSSFMQPLNENGSISTTENGVTTTIMDNGENRSVVLQLLIRDEIATASHWQQIAQARENLAQRYQIVLEVVIIP